MLILPQNVTIGNISSEVSEECRQRFTERLKSFLESKQTVLKFPTSLTSSERKCVHQVRLNHYFDLISD